MRRIQRVVGVTIGALTLASVATADVSREIEVPTTARTSSGTISTQEAVNRGMSCNLTVSDLSCYATHGHALTAGRRATAVAAGPAATATASDMTSVAAAAATVTPLTVWVNAGFSGASLNVYVQSVWINLTGTFNNSVSSWRPGSAGGYLADGANGGGTRVGLPAGSSSSSLGSFDNKASSVKRCPC